MTLFARLKTFVDDDPTDLVNDAICDESVRDLCADLYWDVFFLELAERDRPELFANPVDPAFIAAWRDYQKRYEAYVGWISSCVLLSGIGAEEEDDLSVQLGRDRPVRPTPEDRWKSADDSAAEVSGRIDLALDFAKDQIGQDDRWTTDQQGWVDEISEGIDVWSSLRNQMGIDIHGILRRRAMVPFVLVPRKVANQQGSEQRTALLRNLKEAQDAFVRGTMVSCVVLLRATVEVALKVHYRSFGTDLNERINSLRGKLPFGVTVRELHELRELANSLLHDPSAASPTYLSPTDSVTEIKVVEMLLVVRALIEGIK